jgi:hypothetical protein
VVIDSLVSEAGYRSDGAIASPSRRQSGHVFFDFDLYGHASGTVFDKEAVWLWFDRSAIDVDHSQFNYPLAHDDDHLYVVLMNECEE